jgi:ABC-type Fe3+/spermidine/putrescine transport system ATPase subunit
MFLQAEHIQKQFGAEQVLRDISFNLVKNETLAVLGRSGCGKTTLLKCIAGLLEPDAGNIIVDGLRINDITAHKRNIVYLYQEPLLFPHLNVSENIAFGLRLRNVETTLISSQIKEMIQALELEGQEKKPAHKLSGGQKQRVAFGRALIINPKIILLDEPFGNLDTESRAVMQQLFKKIAGTYHITSLFVTHDLREALLMGDRFAYMQNGMLKNYASKNDFIEDEQTGIKKEMDFWKKIG